MEISVWNGQYSVLDKYKVQLDNENIDYQKQLQAQKEIHAQALKSLEDESLIIKQKFDKLELELASQIEESQKVKSELEQRKQEITIKESIIGELN